MISMANDKSIRDARKIQDAGINQRRAILNINMDQLYL